MMSNQLNRLDSYEFLKELNDMCTMANDHFKEHILPDLLKRKQKLSTISRGISYPINYLPEVPLEHELEDRLYINIDQRKENSELKSKVWQNISKAIDVLKKFNRFFFALGIVTEDNISEETISTSYSRSHYVLILQRQKKVFSIPLLGLSNK